MIITIIIIIIIIITIIIIIITIIIIIIIIINNYWMRLIMISRIIQTEVNVICWNPRLWQITLTLVWIILDIMRKPNPIIVLLYIQNSDRCKKRFTVKRLERLTFQTAAGHFRCFIIFVALWWLRHQCPIIFFWTAPSNNSRYSAEMMSRFPDIEN